MDADTFTVTGDTHQNSTMEMLLKLPLFNGDTGVSVQCLMCLHVNYKHSTPFPCHKVMPQHLYNT